MINFDNKKNKDLFLQDLVKYREDEQFSGFFEAFLDYLEYNIDKWGSVSQVDISHAQPYLVDKDGKQETVYLPRDNDAIMREMCILKGRCMAYQGLKNFLKTELEKDEKNGGFRIKQRSRGRSNSRGSGSNRDGGNSRSSS